MIKCMTQDLNSFLDPLCYSVVVGLVISIYLLSQPVACLSDAPPEHA